MAQGLSSVEPHLSLIASRRSRRHTGSAPVAWLISLLLHAALFAGWWHVVYQAAPAPRRIIIPEARLAPPGAPAGELAPSASVPPAQARAVPPPAWAAGEALPAAPMPTLPDLPEPLPLIAAPAGDSIPVGAAFVSAAISPSSGAGAGTGAGRGVGGGGAAALAGAGPVTSFFGQGGNAYKVVYVVDASASIGLLYLGDIVRQMRRSIDELVPTQSFHIIVAENRTIREMPTQRLVPANARYKKEAERFLETLGGTGRADPIEAMRRAFAVGPELIYFLSDGDHANFNIDEEFENTLAQLNPRREVTIMTLSFEGAISPDGTKLLKRIATRHGGHFRLIPLK